jgi:hypothetical protein
LGCAYSSFNLIGLKYNSGRVWPSNLCVLVAAVISLQDHAELTLNFRV